MIFVNINHWFSLVFVFISVFCSSDFVIYLLSVVNISVNIFDGHSFLLSLLFFFVYFKIELKLSRSVGCGRFYCYCAIVHCFSIVYQNKRQQQKIVRFQITFIGWKMEFNLVELKRILLVFFYQISLTAILY